MDIPTKTVYVDASPTRACYVIGEHRVDYHITTFQGRLNNAVAELKSIIIAMGNISGDLNIFCDNQTIVKIINDNLHIPNSKYYDLMVKYHNLMQNRNVNVFWISRKSNKAGKILDKIKNKSGVKHFDNRKLSIAINPLRKRLRNERGQYI